MTRVKCPSCARTVRAYQPHGGDGSALQTFRHKTKGRQCRGGLVTILGTPLAEPSDSDLVARAREGSMVAFRELEEHKFVADAKRGAAPVYPEHEKLKAIADKSQTCGAFVEWLQQRYTLAKYHVHDKHCIKTATKICGMIGNTLYPEPVNIRKLLAEFFEIDEEKIEDEKRAMLAALRKDGR